MIRVGICDNDRNAVLKLNHIVKQWFNQYPYRTNIMYYCSSEALLQEIELHGFFNLVFLEVELKEAVNGIEIASRIKKEYPLTEIVFFSKSHDYYKEAFLVKPLQCVEKPFNYQELFNVLEHYFELDILTKENYCFQYNKVFYSLRIERICYVEQKNRMIYIYYDGNRLYKAYIKMKEIEACLYRSNQEFLRVHQSFLVNYNEILELHYNEIIMKNQDKIPISYQYRKLVKNRWKF